MKINESQLEALAKGFLEHAGQKGWFSESERKQLWETPEGTSSFVGMRVPSWCEQGELQLSHAAHDQTRESIDFSKWSLGSFGLVLDLKRDQSGKGYLELSWKATEPNPKSWWIAFFLNQDPDELPALDYELGNQLEGHELFTSQVLGFDPYSTPFRYMVYVRETEIVDSTPSAGQKQPSSSQDVNK